MTQRCTALHTFWLTNDRNDRDPSSSSSASQAPARAPCILFRWRGPHHHLDGVQDIHGRLTAHTAGTGAGAGGIQTRGLRAAAAAAAATPTRLLRSSFQLQLQHTEREERESVCLRGKQTTSSPNTRLCTEDATQTNKSMQHTEGPESQHQRGKKDVGGGRGALSTPPAAIIRLRGHQTNA